MTTLTRSQIFKFAFKITRKNDENTVIDHQLKSVIELKQKTLYETIYRNPKSRDGHTRMSQPIAEALGITVKMNPNKKDFFSTNEDRSIFEAVIYIPKEFKKNLQDPEIEYYKTKLNFNENEISVGAYDKNDKFIPIISSKGTLDIVTSQDKDLFHFHDKDMMIPIFSTFFLANFETNKQVKEEFETLKELEEERNDEGKATYLFIKLCEDLYQGNKDLEIVTIYTDVELDQDENLLGEPEEITLFNEIKEGFSPDDFLEEQLDYIPKMPSEMVLDKNLIAKAKAIYHGDALAVLFHGQAGTGKSSACKLICQEINLPLMEVISCVHSSDESILGKFVPKGEEIVFMESNFTKAIRYGGAVVLEEVNYPREGKLGFLNSLLDDNGFVILDTGEKVKRHKNFRLMATMNQGYAGTNPVNEALYNRFSQKVEIKEAPESRIKKMLETRVPECKEKLDIIMDVYQSVKNAIKVTQSDSGLISPRDLENWARAAKYEGWKKAAESTIVPCANFDEELEQKIRKILKSRRIA